jgi:hypothetical protein
MSTFPFCCSPVGTGRPPPTVANVGGFFESYVGGTGPNPFEFRTLQSSDGSITVAQNADNIDLTVDVGASVSLANVGGFAQVYVGGTGPNPFEFRTLQSSDGSITVAQNADNIDLTVDVGASLSLANVGGFAQVYVGGTGPNPFEFRTLQSSDGSITIAQNATNVDLTVDFGASLSLANVGGFAQFYVGGSGPNPFNLRTLQSSDGSVTITQNATNVDLTVAAVDPIKVFQVDSTASQSTTSTTYQNWHTTAAIAEILNGEEWKINWCVGVCHPANVFTVNTQIRIQVETAAAVFTDFDIWQIAWPITIVSGTSAPAHRTKKLTASMNTPRFRFGVRMNAVQASATLAETPRVGGVLIP